MSADEARGPEVTLNHVTFRTQDDHDRLGSKKNRKRLRKVARMMRCEFWRFTPPPAEFNEDAFVRAWKWEDALRRAHRMGYVPRPGCLMDQLQAYWHRWFKWCHLPFTPRAQAIIARREHFVWQNLPHLVSVWPPAGVTRTVDGVTLIEVLCDMVKHCPCVLCLPGSTVDLAHSIPVSVHLHEDWKGPLTSRGQDSGITQELMSNGAMMYYRMEHPELEDDHFKVIKGPHGFQYQCLSCAEVCPNPVPPHWKIEHLAGQYFHEQRTFTSPPETVQTLGDDAPAHFCRQICPRARAASRHKIAVQSVLLACVGDVRKRFSSCPVCARTGQRYAMGAIRSWIAESLGDKVM
eukprot:CAMPEP_0181314384 /NCGR_PEP_ID=MMETSP1101-20121128/14790_1 /TAXON_ID=46948 /ORGANISM="Rhodomonas abbreviata, Strain Caron Lab Isolate" /LENGTH=348 /DNA_ID=CAMNT_0023421475 /DNA_START=37 /DNA_END=1083 /DNA_ORIENTATION=+